MSRFFCTLDLPSGFDPKADPSDRRQTVVSRIDTGSGVFQCTLTHESGVRVWQHPNGSFVAVDGEVFAGAGTSSLETLLGDVLQGPAAAFAGLNSAASIVVWNAPGGELLFARDRYGQAPAFFTAVNRRLAIAADLPSLLSADLDPKIDLQALDCFLARGVLPAPLTFVSGARKLAPGEYLRAKPNKAPEIVCYFRATALPRLALGRLERVRQLKARLLPAIERRRAAQGPTAMLLSSGVDSALVLACLVKELGSPAEAFTFSYGDYSGAFNESERAKSVADYLGVGHHKIECGPQDVIDWLARMSMSYGEPMSFGLHSFMTHAIKQHGLSTAMTGVGSDCFGISDSGWASVRLRTMPAALRGLAESAWRRAVRLAPGLANASYAVAWSNRYDLPSCLHPALTHDEDRVGLYADKDWAVEANLRTLAIFHSAAYDFSGEPAIAKWNLTGQRCFTAEGSLFWNAVWGRNAGIHMAHPFLDNDVHELMMRLGRPGKGKSYVRELAEDLLPLDVARAPKIHQTIPIGHWLRGPLRGMMEDYLSASRIGDLFDIKAVEALKQQHVTGARDHTWRLWAMISVSAWRRYVLDVVREAPSIAESIPEPAVALRRTDSAAR